MSVELRDVSLAYHRATPRQVVALRQINLSIATGEFVTIVGSNGAGKTSLNNVISGASRPSTGSVRIDGRDVTRDPDYRRAHAIARVFDDPLRGTAPTLSIEENLALALAQGKRSLRFALNERRRKIMCEALEQLGLGLENRLTDTVQLLSAGQRQSLTLVMASLRQPSVLLLDEHVAALDPRTQKTVLDITVALVGRLRCTTVMVTHNMNHAIAFGDRLLVMSRGEVIADFPHAEKTNLTTERLVLHIAEVGDVVSDRMYLMEHDGHSNVKRTKSL